MRFNIPGGGEERVPSLGDSVVVVDRNGRTFDARVGYVHRGYDGLPLVSPTFPAGRPAGIWLDDGGLPFSAIPKPGTWSYQTQPARPQPSSFASCSSSGGGDMKYIDIGYDRFYKPELGDVVLVTDRQGATHEVMVGGVVQGKDGHCLVTPFVIPGTTAPDAWLGAGRLPYSRTPRLGCWTPRP